MHQFFTVGLEMPVLRVSDELLPSHHMLQVIPLLPAYCWPQVGETWIVPGDSVPTEGLVLHRMSVAPALASAIHPNPSGMLFVLLVGSAVYD